MKSRGGLTFREAAFEILKRSGRPMKPKAIVEEAISKKLLFTSSKRPEATLNVHLHNDKRFVKTGKGFWELR